MNTAATKEHIEAAFKKVDRKVNIILFTFLGLMIPLSFLYEGSSIECRPLNILFTAVFAGTLALLIRHTVTAKKIICIKNGLVCPRCGKPPKAFPAIPSLKQEICFRCKKEMKHT
ncbi:hypothetical protein [Pontiella sp.]|uniref:hypothetical protein n=1 Tax=Pontiella sp. TaxID=2837462 RepID=UPI003568D7A5